MHKCANCQAYKTHYMLWTKLGWICQSCIDLIPYAKR